MIENLDLLENIWLRDKPFLSGDEISISDLVAACEVEQPSRYFFFYFLDDWFLFLYALYTGMAGFDPLDNRSNLTRWIDRVRSKFSPFYEEAHEIVEQTHNEYKRYQNELNKAN